MTYLETKEIIEKVEALVKKYDINDDDFKQELFVMLLQERNNGKDFSSCESIMNSMLQDYVEEEILDASNEDIAEYEDTLTDENESNEDLICLRIDLDKLFSKNLSKTETELVKDYFGLGGKSPYVISKVVKCKNNHEVLQSILNVLDKLRNCPDIVFLKDYLFEI